MEILRILSLNPGSSSIKAKLFDDLKQVQAWKQAVNGPKEFGAALTKILSEAGEVDAVSCRVVDGGPDLRQSCVASHEVVKALGRAADQAPLHSKESLEVVHVMTRDHPDLPLVLAFDTAFHVSLTPVASTYALPHELVESRKIRRFGFHGLAYQSAVNKLRTAGVLPFRLLAAHLGSGSSACAVHGGTSLDTTMGFTPLEGLVMGTRSGSIDPGLMIYLLQNGYSASDLSRLLNEESGLKGVSGLSSDVRELEKSDDPRAAFALELFCYSAAKHMASLAVALGGVDGLCFSGGIGENSALVREKVCRYLAPLGVNSDLAEPSDSAVCPISIGKVHVYVVKVDEELEIAREANRLVGG